jgi:ribosomal protein S27E
MVAGKNKFDKRKGKWIKIKCAQCGKQFPYFRVSNVIRKFCSSCAASRIKMSKIEFELSKKNGSTRNPEEIVAQSRLKNIPDAINWYKVLDEIAKEI